MKQATLYILLLILTPAISIAQISISDSYFPEAGDTLYTAVDNLPSEIEVTPPGENQSWDFTSLEAPFSQRSIYRQANEGEVSSSFPAASIVSTIAENLEGYYSVTDESFDLIGLYGADPLDLGLNLLTQIDPAIPERRAPLNYFDINQSESAILLPFSTDDLPSGLLDDLPITPDSLRLRIAIERLDVVDAWGTLTLPGEISYDVLREKRTEVRETRLDARIGFLDWLDITDVALEALPEEGAEALGMDTTITQHFFSNEAKEPIAVLTLNNEGTIVEQVRFKSNDIVSSIQNIDNLKSGVYAFPNPAIMNVRFEFSNLTPGNYDLKIFNIVGNVVWQEKYYINGSRAVRVDISNFRKGTYLYNLIDSRGKTLATKRLIVLRP